MTERELYHYKMTSEETEKWNELKSQVINDCKTMQIPLEFNEWIERKSNAIDSYNHIAGYCEKVGYFYIEDGDRGDIYLKCCSRNPDDIRWYILEQIVQHVGQNIELRYRKVEEKNWRNLRDYKNSEFTEQIDWKYNAIHDTRKFWFEYEILALSKVFDSDKLKPFVEEHINLMNRWFNEPHWSFDWEIMSFIEVSNSLEL